MSASQSILGSGDLDDFTFEEERHEYRDGNGVLCPGVTTTLKNAGCVYYPPHLAELIERKRIIGNLVHKWTAQHDIAGWNDPLLLPTREMAYARGWLDFKRHMRPKIIAVEKPMLRTISGMKVGGTPDLVCEINRKMYIIDKKCCASPMPVWDLQLCDYEMMITGAPYVGLYERMSVRLTPDGRWWPKIYKDERSGDVAIAALKLAYDPENYRAQATIDAWKFNNNLMF